MGQLDIFYIWRVNWKIYPSLLIIALAFFALGSKPTALNPNQEIVVKFSSESISDSHIKEAVSEVTDQLLAIGIEDFHVSEIAGNKLKVTYYSSVDVELIKKLLIKHQDLAFAGSEDSQYPEIPFKKRPFHYQLEVVKISPEFNSGTGFQAVLVDLKSGNNQYLKPNLAVSLIAFSIAESIIQSSSSELYSKPYLLPKKIPVKLDQDRAGPFVC